MKPTNRDDHKHRKNPATRISMSLAPKLLKQYDKSMIQAGFSDRSKAIQAALHAFVDENEWKGAENQSGAGAVFMLYNNHTTIKIGNLYMHSMSMPILLARLHTST